MQRPLATLVVAAVLLLTQWGLLAHEFAEHDNGYVCEICVSAGFHQAVLPAAAPVVTNTGYLAPFHALVPSLGVQALALRGQPIRAPPAVFLS